MAEMKFSCTQCGQNISCDEAWAGQQIQCPACQNNLIVPNLQPPLAAAVPAARPQDSQPSIPNRPRLAAGATQVPRPTPTANVPRRPLTPRPPKTGNPLIKFAVILVVLAVAGVVGLKYLPGLLSQVQEMGTSKTPASGTAEAGTAGGPLGSANEAMDVSEALDGGGSSKPRASAAKRPAVGQPPATAVTNSAAKSTHK